MMAGVEGEVDVVVVGGGGGPLAVVAAGSGDEAGGLRGVEPWAGARLVREGKEVSVMVVSGCCGMGESGVVWCQEKGEEVCGGCGSRLGKVGGVVKGVDCSSSRRSSQFNMVFPLITFVLRSVGSDGLPTPFCVTAMCNVTAVFVSTT
jgi:hypothetical protein